MELGLLLADRFQLQSLAGSGGMGRVYRAWDRRLGAVVAVKVLRDRFAHDRFTREAEMLASLTHPAIVRFIDAGMTAEGEAWLAMEWVEGESLAERLVRGPLSVASALTLARVVAGALAEAHAASIVHRDLKPENLLLEGGDVARAKLLDFGVARIAGAATGNAATGTGIAVGTPGYMAPEQARGARELGPAADVFALGCVLFECVAGRPAFVAAHVMALLAKILIEDAPRLAEVATHVPPAVDAFVAHLLVKDPAGRPADGAAVLAALDGLDLGGALRDGARTSVRPEPQRIGEDEQELLNVVMATTPPSGDAGTAPTLDAFGVEQGFAELAAVAATYGGRLEPLVGGAFVVTLRGRGAAVDRVARAARFALVLRGLAPHLTIALATGRGRVAERWPVGEAIDRAAALLRKPRAGARDGAPIRIDGVTEGLAELRFVLGRDETSALLMAERRDDGAARTLLGKPAPCVGRDRELALLDALFEECATEPITRAALVTAPAGAGKSRVRYELLRRLAERGVRVLLARGDAMSAGTPFGLLAEVLGAAVGFAVGEARDARRVRLSAYVTELVGPARAAEVAPFLSEIAGVPWEDDTSAALRAARRDPVLMGDQTVRAFETWVAAECARGPVALVLEDLHWGDGPTVRLVDAVLRGAPERPLFVLALARPEVFDAFPGLWAERDVLGLALSELTPKSSERIVRTALGDAVPKDVVKRLVDRAAGNAFYLEELIRAASEGQGEAAPETVLAMVGARLEALPAETRRVLRAASFFGGIFWSSGVERLLGAGDPTDVPRELEELVRRELVAARPEPRFPGEKEYIFRHALVRDGAYATLTEDDRRVGHRLAGHWLAQRGEPSALVVAGHFERGGEPARAVPFLLRAAEQALDANDFSATLEHVARGITCGAAGEDRGRLHLFAAEVHGWRGDREAQAREGNLAMAALAPWSPAYCDAAREIVQGLGHGAKRDALIAQCEALLGGPVPATPELVVAMADCLIQRLRLGDYRGSEPMVAWLRRHAGAICDRDPGVAVRVHLADAWWGFCRGEPGDPTRETATLLAFEAVGDRRSATRAQLNLGYAYLELGQFELAEVTLTEAAATTAALGLTSLGTTVRQNLGMTLGYLGRFDEARALLHQSAAEAQVQGDQRLAGSSFIYLARIALSCGELADSLVCAERAARTLEPSPALRSDAFAFVAEVRLRLGDLPGALEAGGAAQAVLDELGSIEEGESHVRLVLTELHLAAGRREQAEAHIRDARERLLSRAAFIADGAHRASFLTRMPDNARTLALAAELLDGAAEHGPEEGPTPVPS